MKTLRVIVADVQNNAIVRSREMQNLRGIVLDVQKDHVIVLTPEADIVEVETHGQKFELGQEILFYERKREKPARKRALLYASALVASILLFHDSSSLIESPVDKPPVSPVTALKKQHTEGNTENKVAMVSHPVNTDKPDTVHAETKKLVHIDAPEVRQPEVPARQPEKVLIRQPEKVSAKEQVRQPERALIRHTEKAPVRQPEQEPIRHPEKAPVRELPVRQPEGVPVRHPEKAPVTAPVTVTATAKPSEIGVQIGILDVVEGMVKIGQGTAQIAVGNDQGENDNAQ